MLKNLCPQWQRQKWWKGPLSLSPYTGKTGKHCRGRGKIPCRALELQNLSTGGLSSNSCGTAQAPQWRTSIIESIYLEVPGTEAEVLPLSPSPFIAKKPLFYFGFKPLKNEAWFKMWLQESKTVPIKVIMPVSSFTSITLNYIFFLNFKWNIPS